MVPEVEQEFRPVSVELKTARGSAQVQVPPANRWRSSGVHALRLGDSFGWAQSVLTAADMRTWARLDPDGDELAAFMDRWAQETGTTVGESSALPTS
jgi:hypothetical protein